MTGVSGPSAAGIYVASKSRHAPLWRAWREAGTPITASWIDEAAPADYVALWSRCVAEASTAAVSVVYAEDGETLKGALVEVGAALAAGRPVICVGLDPATHSWIAHPGVIRVYPAGALAAALGDAEGVASGAPVARSDTFVNPA